MGALTENVSYDEEYHDVRRCTCLHAMPFVMIYAFVLPTVNKGISNHRHIFDLARMHENKLGNRSGNQPRCRVNGFGFGLFLERHGGIEFHSYC